MKNKFTRKILSFLLFFSIISQFWLPLYANDQLTQKAITYHSWAAPTLFEGERLELIPIEWYDNMLAPVDQAALNTLLNNVDNKLSKLGFPASGSFNNYEADNNITRETVLEGLYHQVLKYELAETVPETASHRKAAIDFMLQKSVLRGDGNNYNLDKVCTLEEAALFATRLVETLCKEANVGSKGFFWKVSDDDTTVYLLGSVHVAKHDIYPMSTKIKEAFKNSDALAVEANIISDQEGILYLQEKMQCPDGTTIYDYISEETAAKLDNVMANIGMKKEQYMYLKPWALSQQLSQLLVTKEGGVGSSPYSGTLGIDIYFIINALYSNKPILELESIKYQADMLDSFSPEYQEKQLAETLKGFEDPALKNESAEILDTWLNQWIEGNTEAFCKSYFNSIEGDEETKEEFTEKTFTLRNNNMTEAIKQYLDSGNDKSYFVVVGSGHMIGDTGIVAQLEALGYEVEAIK